MAALDAIKNILFPVPLLSDTPEVGGHYDQQPLFLENN